VLLLDPELVVATCVTVDTLLVLVVDVVVGAIASPKSFTVVAASTAAFIL
jgi:hypothetical protein